MDSLGKNGRGETEAHLRLKRRAILWAQAHDYSACATEVTLPRCRYRADVAAYRQDRHGVGSTIVFECKQCLPDLRRDNGCSANTRDRLMALHRRRETLEKNLRVHYPALRIPDSLFAEFDSHDFGVIDHRGYKQVLRQQRTLQNRLFDGTKFETLRRYCCANLFFLVLPNELFRAGEIPFGWGALVEQGDELVLAHKALWHDVAPANQLRFLERIARAGTRLLNRQLAITFEEIATFRCRSCS